MGKIKFDRVYITENTESTRERGIKTMQVQTYAHKIDHVESLVIHKIEKKRARYIDRYYLTHGNNLPETIEQAKYTYDSAIGHVKSLAQRARACDDHTGNNNPEIERYFVMMYKVAEELT